MFRVRDISGRRGDLDQSDYILREFHGVCQAQYWAVDADEREANDGFKLDPNDPKRCMFCHRKHCETVRAVAPFGHKGRGVSRIPT